jgi:hypothetical protein
MDIQLQQIGAQDGTDLCGIAYSPVTKTWYSGNADGEICPLSANAERSGIVEDAITAIAVNPNGEEIVFATEKSVFSRKVSDPTEEHKKGSLVRSTLDIRQLEFGSDGSHM